jgi:septum formation protein
MLILASKSPRRVQLMKSGGYDFEIVPVTVNEQIIFGEAAGVYVSRIASLKARAASDHAQTWMNSGDLIISADTAVVYQERNINQTAGWRDIVLGKPADRTQAEKMLRRLRGGQHQVCTAIVVYDPFENKKPSAIQYSTVEMRDYTDSEMVNYLESGDPLNKAGGYAIQNPDFHPAQFVQGCYPNVMGLPVCLLRRLLEEFGVFPSHESVNDCQEVSNSPCWIYTHAQEIAERGGNQ